METDWLTVAKSLPVGRKARISCCDSDTSMMIAHNVRGWSAWCFRCKRNEFQSHGEMRISDILRYKAESEFTKNKTVKLPDDYTLDIPMAKAVWFMKAGISPELARLYHIGYAPSMDRIVLPVYENSRLTAIQLRACNPNQEPKYLNPQDAETEKAVFWSQSDYSTSGVVTEDILSAIKIGRVLNSASILGTSLSDARALKIARRWSHVALWLDPDKAGTAGAKEAARKLQMQGCSVVRLKSEKDPKLHSFDEIESILNIGRESD